MQCGSVGRCHEPDARRNIWNRLFPGFVEQSLRGKTLFQQFELTLEIAEPHGAQTADIELILSALHINGQFAVCFDLGTLAHFEFGAFIRAAEVDRLDLG